MLQTFTEYFRDPRFGRERLLLWGGLPAALVILSFLLTSMFFDVMRETFRLERTASPVPDHEIPSALIPETPDLLVLADEEIRLGNLGKAEEILQGAIQRGDGKAAAQRKLGTLFQREEKYSEAMEAFSAAILLAPEAKDFFLRGHCAFLIGNSEQAGQDFASAARLSPSNPLYSNRHFLALISQGDTETVRSRMNLDIRLGVINTMEGWIVAAAAVALQEGNVKPASDLLSEAAMRFSREDLNFLLQDPVFDPYRQIPSLTPYLVISANAANRTSLPPR